MNKIKPTRWFYVLAILLPIFACLGTGLLVYLNVPELPGAPEDIGVKSLTQVVVPGSADISFPQKGAYAVYYEYHSVIDGVSYAREEYPPMMRCQLISKATLSQSNKAGMGLNGKAANKGSLSIWEFHSSAATTDSAQAVMAFQSRKSPTGASTLSIINLCRALTFSGSTSP
jgi:hypothetical protein